MRDSHPRKRQAQAAERKLGRAKASRQGLPVILVVCEGTETEPNYLRGLCETRRINLANVRIETGSATTDALSLVKKARRLFAKTEDYDRIYVVLDGDDQSLEEARQLAQKVLRTNSGDRIHVVLIVSEPAFEFWLLLHFEYTTRSFASAAEAIGALRAYLTDYDKADEHIFQQVDTGLDQAMTNVERLKRDLAATGNASPNTDMHLLISQMLTMVRAE